MRPKRRKECAKRRPQRVGAFLCPHALCVFFEGKETGFEPGKQNEEGLSRCPWERDGPKDRKGEVRARFSMQHAEHVRIQNREAARFFQTDVANMTGNLNRLVFLF